MLRHLAISNFVLIEQCQLDFSAGLCVFTGETGAGKSILLDALGLVLGGRLSPGQVLREPGKQAVITAEFSLTPAHYTLLEDAGIAVAEEGVLLKRVILPEGAGSRCLVNDQPVSLTFMKTLGEALVEIHGQHGQRDLTDTAKHREMLDDFAGLGSICHKTEVLFSQWQQAKQALDTVVADIAATRREEEYLRHVAEELNQLKAQKGEEETLAAERSKLMKAEQLGGLLQEAIGELRNTQALHHAQRLLLRSDAARLTELQAVIDGLERAQIEVMEVNRQLEMLIEEYGYDPKRLELVEERLFALRAAARKHQVSVEELPDLLVKVKASLAALTSQEELLNKLNQQLVAARNEFYDVAQALSQKRAKAAQNLAKLVMTELAALKMAATRFQARQDTLPEEQWNASGIDRIVFEVSTNPGSPFGPLHKIASGGELSRFMLALKVVLARHKSDTTLIFDEIDTGTSGAVADAIGERLARLGMQQQVMVITHLPQVASKGESHFKVAKEQGKQATRTTVTLLDKVARQEELAQMLSGKEITAEARQAAAKLMEKRA